MTRQGGGGAADDRKALLGQREEPVVWVAGCNQTTMMQEDCRGKDNNIIEYEGIREIMNMHDLRKEVGPGTPVAACWGCGWHIAAGMYHAVFSSPEAIRCKTKPFKII